MARRLPTAANPQLGRRGHRWRQLKAEVFTTETICWLCGKPVDQTLPPNHNLARSVDHVIPLSRGGDPLDRANARLAHRVCNSRRRDTTPTRHNPRTDTW